MSNDTLYNAVASDAKGIVMRELETLPPTMQWRMYVYSQSMASHFLYSHLERPQGLFVLPKHPRIMKSGKLTP